MTLYIDNRPKTFDEILGNEETVESLKSLLENKDEFPHSLLFYGASGCGKTTLARIVASELGCPEDEIMEINASNNRGIDTARELIENMNFRSMSGKSKVYILDESQSMTRDGQSALLKALEDTPKHVYFILCTTEPEKLLKTIVNRCIQFRVETLSYRLTARLVGQFIESNNELNKAIHEASGGSPRLILTLIEKIKGLPIEKQLKAISQIKLGEAAVIDLCRALLDKKQWNVISRIIKDLDEEPEKIRYAILGYMNSVLLGGNEQAAYIIACFRDSFMYVGKAGLTLACWNAITD